MASARPGGHFACARIVAVRQGPALLGEHQHLLRGPTLRVGEAGLDQGHKLGGAVLESQRADERKAQRGVHLGGVLPGEHGFRTGGRLGHLAGA
jgi:hypothetical protein